MSNTTFNSSLHPDGPGNWKFSDLARCTDCGLLLGQYGHLTINCGERDYELAVCNICGDSDPHDHPEETPMVLHANRPELAVTREERA